MVKHEVTCVACESDKVVEYPHCEGVLECLECGELFDDDDYILEILREKYKRQADQPWDL